MQTIRGRVQRFLGKGPGKIGGFVLDNGIEVRFPSLDARQIFTVIEIGASAEIRGLTRPDSAAGRRFDVAAIINRETSQVLHFENLPLPHDPEVPPPSIATEEAASLPPLPPESLEHPASSTRRLGLADGVSGERTDQGALPNRPTNRSQTTPKEPANSTRSINREGAARKIEYAYDALHRTQAILAYVKIVDLKYPDVGRLLEQARDSYIRALSSYQHANFTAADELAAASRYLSAAAEGIVSRIFRSSANSPTLVPPPPRHQATQEESAQALNRILRTEKSLSRIRWLLENGTMPQEDVEEVEEISTWCERYFQRAQRSFHAGWVEDSADSAETAYAIAQAAEHLCKKCYVSRESSSHSVVMVEPSD
jgi:hypothetical protein